MVNLLKNCQVNSLTSADCADKELPNSSIGE